MGFEDQFIRNRVNMPTAKSSAEIARDIPAGIRARSFFSARVAEAHILERFRKITDDYNTGRIGRDEARNLMLEYARAHGKDDGTRGLKNLASTARLDLIVDQNAKMAHAVGEHERMYSESAMRVFPYVIYHASVGSKKPRSEHQKYDGMIFEKTDPWLKTHTPPWEFGCNCQLEQITAKRAGKTPERIQKPIPPDQVHVDSRSGFTFDPATALEMLQLDSIKSVKQKQSVARDMQRFAEKSKIPVTMTGTPSKAQSVCREPENLNEIKDVIQTVKKSIDEHAPNTAYTFPAVQCSLGFIGKERFESVGLQPEDNVEVIFESPGKSDYGMKHWKKHHLEDWTKENFINYLLQMLRATIWNSNAAMKITLEPNAKRISVQSPDGKYIANIWRRGEKWVYSIQDAWDWDKSGSKD